MAVHSATSPLSQRELIEQHFVEHRTMVLDIAAFLDRLDRAREIDASDDFRLRGVSQGPPGALLQRSVAYPDHSDDSQRPTLRAAA